MQARDGHAGDVRRCSGAAAAARPDVAGRRPDTAVVLSHEFWQRRFGGDPHIVGRTIAVDGRAAPSTIARRHARETSSFPYRSMLGPSGFTRAQHADLWLPLTPAGRRRLVDAAGQPNRNIHYLAVIAPAQARRRRSSAAARSRRDRARSEQARFPDTNRGWRRHRPAAARADRRRRAAGAADASGRRRRRAAHHVHQRRERAARARDGPPARSGDPIRARRVARAADAADARREPVAVASPAACSASV